MRKLVLVTLVGTLLAILFGDKVPATLVRAVGIVVWGAGTLVAVALLVMTWRHRQLRRTLLPIAGCFGAFAVTYTAAADRHPVVYWGATGLAAAFIGWMLIEARRVPGPTQAVGSGPKRTA